MIGLLQRVTQASVRVDNEIIGAIDQGILVLVGVAKSDTRSSAERLIERLLSYRVFADAAGKMNRSVVEIDGGVLLVPQFTLVAATNKGTRPSFSSGAAPPLGKELFDHGVAVARQRHRNIATGRFGADMQVALINDGPVTFWIEVK